MKKMLYFPRKFVENFSYAIFLSIYLILKLLEKALQSRIFPKALSQKVRDFNESLFRSLKFLLPYRHGIRIMQLDLIDMSFKTLLYRKSRTMITVGGMAIGIGVIVFLVSIGYGLQEYVITRIATLDELRRIEVVPLVGNKMNLSSDSLSTFREFSEVTKVMPITSLIAKVSYAGSESTVVSYGVSPEYLSVPWVNSSNLNNQIENKSEIMTQDLETISSKFNNVISLGSDIKREIIVNTNMLRLLGLNSSEGVDKTLKISFTVPSELLESDSETLDTNIDEYRIIGILNEGNTPNIFFPIENLSRLQLPTYSSVRIIISDQFYVPQTRAKVEAMGFKTSSVLDTINQVETIFSNIRVFLTLLGLIALSIASLGIFNTLTVSLLERTKEIGLLKVMGMDSAEIKNLFLTESLLLSLSGCFAGIIFGFISGKVLSLIITLITFPVRGEWVDISKIPLSLVLLVLVLSFFVGILTGLYPSIRAKKIPALNALRYE